MPEVSVFRLYLLRAGYLLLVAGLGPLVWPRILGHAGPWGLMNGVATAMLGALSLLSVLGLRYPLQMLPLLMFETTWKTVWLLAVALPAWSAGRLDPATAETAVECLMGVIFLVLIPWPYVWSAYVLRRGDPLAAPGMSGPRTILRN